ncbi:CgeB family protein [Chengkuizengella marina]|uniref:Spore maturation protein cgeB n=1 Tax=Chengkuizengella marina TaxID=2507566 RepID=A0A6N9PYW2_9BACL|nr:DUF3880 domain-containing protein [Chengkuizengella marina]NBI28721.1 spore maturation protein cgeB [Chengkuizengella marina]
MKFISRNYFKNDSNHLLNKEINKKNLKLLFVKSGKGKPYDYLEASIIKYFKKEIQQFYTVSPHEQIHTIADKINPDLILCFDGWNMNKPKINLLKNLGFRTAVWFLDDPYYTDLTKTLAPHYDVVFTVEKGCIDFYKSLGCANVYFLPLAVDNEIFNQREKLESKYYTDVLFIGNAHPDRIQYFNAIDLELLKRNLKIIGPGWNKLNNWRLSKNVLINEWISTEETAKYYNGAKIVINMHRSINNSHINHNNMIKIPALSLNPRTFEIAACGAFQLTDIREELENVYIPDYDIATYITAREMLQKIDYYLSYSKKRKQLASRAMEKTLKNETYSKRIEQMLDKLILFLNK